MLILCVVRYVKRYNTDVEHCTCFMKVFVTDWNRWLKVAYSRHLLQAFGFWKVEILLNALSAMKAGVCCQIAQRKIFWTAGSCRPCLCPMSCRCAASRGILSEALDLVRVWSGNVQRSRSNTWLRHNRIWMCANRFWNPFEFRRGQIVSWAHHVLEILQHGDSIC